MDCLSVGGGLDGMWRSDSAGWHDGIGQSSEAANVTNVTDGTFDCGVTELVEK